MIAHKICDSKTGKRVGSGSGEHRMNKKYLEHLDESERKRVEAVVTDTLKAEKLESKDFFRNEEVLPVLFGRRNPFMVGFHRDVLPSTTIFGDSTVLSICDYCGCVKEPSLLEPYLERNLVLPVLTSSYQEYSKDFVDLVLSYPHISAYEYHSFKTLYFTALSKEYIKRGYICPHCVKNEMKKIESALEKGRFSVEIKSRLKRGLEWVAFPNLRPYLYPDYLLLPELSDSLEKRDLHKFRQIVGMTECIRILRTSQSFSLIPQIDYDSLETVQKLLQNQKELEIDYDIVDVRNAVLKGFNLSYSPSIPIETYLDVLSSRKEKIKNLMDNVISVAEPRSETFLIDLHKEIERINSEVRTLEASKRRKFLTLCTNFVKQNKSVVTGCLIGAGMGLVGASLAACGAFGAGIMAKAASKHVNIHVPREAEEVKEAIYKALEPGYEELLARYLSKDLEVIQVWRLKRKFKELKRN